MKRLCIYAEQYKGIADPTAAELVTAARCLRDSLPASEKPEITLLVCGKPEEREMLCPQLAFEDTEILYAETGLDIFRDDGLCRVILKALEMLEPEIILIPALRTARAVFSRAAVRLDAGMTADCAELAFENGEFVQKKSAFGADTMCVCAETGTPKIVTVLTGVYEPAVTAEAGMDPAKIRVIPDPGALSRLTVTGMEDAKEESITGARRILSLGRGALQGNSLDLARAYAEKEGFLIGGTRPLADDGTLPFERQIGQTGCTVHPEICIYMGVSGAVQHTEGVRDAKLTIAVNSDPDAAIFGYADYGAAADMRAVLEELLKDG